MEHKTFFKSRQFRFITIIAVVSMNLGALFMLGLLYFDYHEFHKISHYKLAYGKVLNVDIVEVDFKKELAALSSKNRASNEKPFRVDVSYQYMVDSLWYENNLVYAGGFANNAFYNIAEAVEKAEVYKRKTSVSVFYDPLNPSVSVLDPRLLINRRLLVASFVLIVAGISCTLFLIIVSTPHKHRQVIS